MKIKRILFLVVIGVLSLLFIFGDVALLSDIGKQYKLGLAQPEWLVLYPVMGFQFITAIVFTFLHFFGFSKEKQVNHVARDNNIFLVVQYVGVICGLMGLTSSSLRFLFPGATLRFHIVMSLIILLMPYALVVGYWLITKLQEEHRQWYDEKQIQDIGRSAFLTLVLSHSFQSKNYNDCLVIIFIQRIRHIQWILFIRGNLFSC